MDSPINTFGPEPNDTALDDLDPEEIRDSHPELAHKLEEHQKETGYE